MYFSNRNVQKEQQILNRTENALQRNGGKKKVQHETEKKKLSRGKLTGSVGNCKQTRFYFKPKLSK